MNYKISIIISVGMVLGLSCSVVKGMSPNQKLLFGVDIGSLEDLEKALADGAQVDARDGSGRTALHRATFRDQKDCLRLLLEKGAQIDAQDVNGMSALHIAADGGRLKCLRVLLERGAQIEAKDNNGRTALHWAARKGHDECLRALLERGAQLEAKDIYKMTALHWAAEVGEQDCMKVLLENGAQIEAKQEYGRTALQCASNKECLIALLLAEAHMIVNGTTYRVIAPSKDKVNLSRRRLKVALLALRYAGSDSDDPKLKNAAGDRIVSNEYMRTWLLLSQSEVIEDVFIILMSLMAEGKKVDYPLFRMAHRELGDYLVTKLKNSPRRINAYKDIVSASTNLDVKQVEMGKLCDLQLVEENFGDLIRNGIKARFNEVLRPKGAPESTVSQSLSSSSSTSFLKEQNSTSSR